MAKEDMKSDVAQDKAMIKKAFKQHDAQEHKGNEHHQAQVHDREDKGAHHDGAADRHAPPHCLVEHSPKQQFLADRSQQHIIDDHYGLEQGNVGCILRGRG